MKIRGERLTAIYDEELARAKEFARLERGAEIRAWMSTRTTSDGELRSSEADEIRSVTVSVCSDSNTSSSGAWATSLLHDPPDEEAIRRTFRAAVKAWARSAR